MLHSLKVIAFMTIIAFFTNSILFAAIGTPGGNNEIPWISTDSCQAGANVAFTINGIDPTNQVDFFYFGFSIKKHTKGGKNFPSCGPGACFMPDMSSPYSGKCTLTQNPTTFKIPANFAGETVFCQAIIPDSKAQGGYAFSKLFEIDFFEEYIEPEELTLTPMGSFKTLGRITDAFNFNNTPFLLSKDYGILWLDCGAPSKPEIGGYQDKFAGELELNHVSVEANRGIVTNDNTLFTFTIGADKSIHYHAEKPSYSQSLADCVLNGNYAYVCDFTNKVQVYNVTDLANPVSLGSFTADSYIDQLESYSNMLFVRTKSSILVYNLGNPANPYLVKKIEGDFWSEDIFLLNNIIYLTDSKNDLLHCYRMDAGPTFTEIATVSVADCGEINHIGNQLYVSKGKQGFNIYDISNVNSGSVSLLSDLGFSSNVKQTVMIPYQSHMYSYMATSLYTLESLFVVIDGTSRNILSFSDLDQFGLANSICVVDKYAAVSRKNHGIEVFDISSPQKIAKVDHYQCESIQVTNQGQYIYSGSVLNGIDVFSVSQQGKLTLLHHFATNGVIFNMTCALNHLFVANGYGGLQIYKLGNPSNPVLLHDISGFDDNVIDVCVDDSGYAYVLTGSSLYAFDVGTGQTPTLKDKIDLSSHCFLLNSLEVYHGVAYVCTGSYGVAIVDVSDATDLQFIDMIPLQGSKVSDAAVYQNVILFSNNNTSSGNGISKVIYGFDNTNPLSPSNMFEYEKVYNSNNALEVDDNRLLILDNIGVIMIAEFGN